MILNDIAKPKNLLKDFDQYTQVFPEGINLDIWFSQVQQQLSSISNQSLLISFQLQLIKAILIEATTVNIDTSIAVAQGWGLELYRST